MNSRVSWSVDGIDPSVRERAEAAARRAGMSLNDWLNSTVGESAPPNFRNPIRCRLPGEPATSPTSTSGSIPSPARSSGFRSRRRATTPPREQGVARQLNDAISRLDARLSQISNPQAARQNQDKQQRQTEAVERAASQVYAAQAPAPLAYRNSPPLSPASLDFAVAEIAARQNELDAPPRSMPQRFAPPIAPPPPSPPRWRRYRPRPVRTSRRWNGICSRSRARSSRCSAPISSSRSPRSAASSPKSAPPSPKRCRAGRSNSIENEIRSLSRRIDESRQSGIDNQVLGNIENALNEIRDVLRSLKSAEQLAGYDEAIRNLGAKLDMILRANDDPGTVQQLESAIAALRGIVSNVASNDALVRLSDDVQMLSSKVDQVARASNSSDHFAVLEQRIAALTSALESRERPQYNDNSEQIESALRALSDRFDRMPVGSDSASAFAHLEQRVSYLLERLEVLRRSPRRQSRPRRGRAAGHPAPSRKPARGACFLRRQPACGVRFFREQPAAQPAGAGRRRPGRSRQARALRHPLQPVEDRPPDPGFARSRSLDARPRRRSPCR